jgi:hypothetical protein
MGRALGQYGQTGRTGQVVSIILVRELGPVLTSVMVAGRNASGIASELGSMKVTEQIDAMRALGFFRKSAAEQADRPDPAFGRRFRVIRRVPNRERFSGRHPRQLAQRGFEDVRVWFGLFRFVGGRLRIYQVFYAAKLFIMGHLIRLARGGQGDPDAFAAYLAKQVCHLWKRPDTTEVLPFEKFRPVLGNLLSLLFKPFLGQKFGKQGVSTFADLAPDVRKIGFLAKFGKGPLPDFRVNVDRIHQGTVDVENSCPCTHGGKFAGTTDPGCAGHTAAAAEMAGIAEKKHTQAMQKREKTSTDYADYTDFKGMAGQRCLSSLVAFFRLWHSWHFYSGRNYQKCVLILHASFDNHA